MDTAFGWRTRPCKDIIDQYYTVSYWTLSFKRSSSVYPTRALQGLKAWVMTDIFILTEWAIVCQYRFSRWNQQDPPKAQAALLEAMQERHVTERGIRTASWSACRRFVLATQNPIEQKELIHPEAQLDRFMFLILLQLSVMNRSSEGQTDYHGA